MAKYLIKANDEVLSWCACDSSLVGIPGQLDCPWCGCGWLISCLDCRRAFTFAQVVETDLTYAEIVRRDGETRGRPRNESDAADAAEQLAWMMEPLSVGAQVVYLDGCFIEVGDRDIHFEGIFARHELDALPQVLAKGDQSHLSVIKDVNYWMSRELSDRN